MGPDGELLGVVVHSGLVLDRRKDVVAALRRITAFPNGLALDTVVLARGIHAQAADRRAHAATAHRRAAASAQREDEAAARHDSEAAAQREGAAAAERHHALHRPGSSGAISLASTRATSCASGSPPRPVRCNGWMPSSQRVRRPRITIGWKPPTG